MAKMTLLEIVQDILSDMDSDEVNSIDDTMEAQQVAQIVKSTYIAMMSNRNWPHLKKAVQIQASGTTALPTHMTLQDSIKEMVLINYNVVKTGETRRRYQKVRWLEPEEFLRKSNNLNSDAANVDIIQDTTGVELLIRNDVAPQYYTSFNDTTLVFDSYDNTVDSTLQMSKIQAQAYVMPTWTHTDASIPDLPDEAFTALLEEAKSRASMKLKQSIDSKAEQEASRQNRWLSRKAWRAEGGVKFPNYGRGSRKSSSGTANATFSQDR